MLFINVYKIESLASVDFSFVIYACAVTVLVFFIAIVAVTLLTSDKAKRGALIQSSFRANYALVGIPLATALFGQEGAIASSVLSAFIVPLFNVLAVIALSIFSPGKKPSMKKVLVGIAKNPLIVSIAAGFASLIVRALFVKWGVSFRLTDVQPIYKTLTSLSAVATPLALIVLGAQFELSAVPTLKKEIIFGVCVRNLAVPLFGIGIAYFIGIFTGAHFATFVAVFCTPVAVSSVPMAQEMDADVSLAGQLVVWTTAISAFTVFLAAFILRLVGVFA
jgi:predicted permease